ncbi:hypothetical protein [Subtercola sp. RTI3]|uniref:hypothetical protein n=1 Tax=Subtercola sp. RTI3 TaxID=3048639 RepID=UPI002B22D2BE|nr:hypothetical protein [Subtercola sp. RTI3]MEA9986300.1 hypothetical protein [Subtercola sp. RTI3]
MPPELVTVLIAVISLAAAVLVARINSKGGFVATLRADNTELRGRVDKLEARERLFLNYIYQLHGDLAKSGAPITPFPPELLKE